MKVSICIPCYNVEQYLENLFKSIDNQTFRDFEVVFVDDGSTDNTYKIISSYISDKDKNNYRLYSQQNKGLAETRNVLINYAKGDYIFFLDSDDTIPDNTLEVLWNNSKNGEIDIVVGRAKVIFNKKVKLPFIVQYRYLNNMTNTHYVKSNLCTCWGSIIKKELFNGEKFLKGFSYEDIGLINYIYLKAKSFKSIKDTTYFYWRRNDSISNFNENNKWKIIDIYKQTENTLQKYYDSGMLYDKKYLKSINGTMFQILISTYWLSRYYSNNNLINKLPLYAIDELLKKYGFKLKFSKTFWKSLSFIYLKNPYRGIKYIYEKISKKRRTNQKVEFIKMSEFKNKKSRKIVVLDDGILNQEILDKYKNRTFLSQNFNLKGNNVLYSLKPNKITESLLENERLHIIDLTEFKDFSIKELGIIEKINKRIIILISTNIDLRNKNILKIK